MLLTMDVGNTNITAGIFVEKDLVELFRITTKLTRTSDEFGILIRDMIAAKGLDTKEISAAIIGSVVPNIMYSLTNGIIKYFDVTPVIVGPGIKTGINLGRLNPREVGADRIVDLVAAYEIYGGPTLVIDYGTATTYDVVTEDRAGHPDLCQCLVEGSGKASGDRDKDAGEYTCHQYDHEHAGRTYVRGHRRDKIYH